MSLEELVKYMVWIAFFAIALTGIYFLVRSLGILG